MKIFAFALFVIVINAAKNVEEQMTTTCQISMKETKKTETESLVDVKVDCTGKAGEKTVTKSSTKTCKGNEKFTLATFKPAQKTEVKVADEGKEVKTEVVAKQEVIEQPIEQVKENI